MKKTQLLTAFLLAAFAATSQNIVHVTVCTKFWKTDAPITGTLIMAPGYSVQLDSTQSCAEFDFDLSLLPADATFSFHASKEQDDPLNGVTTVDMIKLSKHIIGVMPIASPFGMIAADANKTNSLTTQDIVKIRNLILGVDTSWGTTAMWRFIPEYWLPFPNPANPFQGWGLNSLSLNVDQLQAFHNGTIFLIGAKTGDVDGDANPKSPLFVPGTDSLDLVMPDIVLQAGVPTVVPVRLAVNLDISSIQLELRGLPGIVSFDSITPGQLSGSSLSYMPDPNQPNIIRSVYSDYVAHQTTSTMPLFYLHLRANIAIALKDAIQIQQSGFHSLVSDGNCDTYRLTLDVSDVVATNTPAAPGLRILAASPNPFQDRAQVQIELERAETLLFEVMDLTGKILLQQRRELNAGIHFLEIPGAVVPEGGMVLYHVQAGNVQASGKLIRSK